MQTGSQLLRKSGRYSAHGDNRLRIFALCQNFLDEIDCLGRGILIKGNDELFYIWLQDDGRSLDDRFNNIKNRRHIFVGAILDQGQQRLQSVSPELAATWIKPFPDEGEKLLRHLFTQAGETICQQGCAHIWVAHLLRPDGQPRQYRYGYGYLDKNFNYKHDKDEPSQKLYFEISNFTPYIFYENPYD